MIINKINKIKSGFGIFYIWALPFIFGFFNLYQLAFGSKKFKILGLLILFY